MALLKVRPQGAALLQECYTKWHRQHQQGRKRNCCHFGKLGVSLQQQQKKINEKERWAEEGGESRAADLLAAAAAAAQYQQGGGI